MAWNPIQTTDIAVKKPVTRALWNKVKDCLTYLYGVASGSTGIMPPNGGMEIDSTGSGVPDHWTVNLYPGGSSGEETANPGQGKQSYKFVHPGGAGNGGGYMDSDYCEVEAGITYAVAWQWYATAPGMNVGISILQFDNLHNSLATIALWSSTANPASWSKGVVAFTTSASVRYVKIRLIGGYTDTNVAGTVYFDDIQLTRQWYGYAEIVDRSITTGKIGAGQVTAYEIAAGTISQTNIGGAAVGQGQLKISGGQVGITGVGATNISANLALPGGLFGFHPCLYAALHSGTTFTACDVRLYSGTASAAQLPAWTGTIFLSATAGAFSDSTLYAYQYYVTSSGEIFWLFLLREKATGNIVAAYAAPDHPCFGNGGKPALMPHPFMALNGQPVDPSAYDIIVVNPDPTQLAEIDTRCSSGSEGTPDRTRLQVILEDYQLADEVPSLASAAAAAAAKTAAPLSADTPAPAPAPPAWPEIPVTVATGVKKVIPQPDYVSLARIQLKAE
jgi:hypothetical protein